MILKNTANIDKLWLMVDRNDHDITVLLIVRMVMHDERCMVQDGVGMCRVMKWWGNDVGNSMQTPLPRPPTTTFLLKLSMFLAMIAAVAPDAMSGTNHIFAWRSSGTKPLLAASFAPGDPY